MKYKILFLLLLIQGSVFAQISAVHRIISQVDSLQGKIPREKVFIHLDKSAYTVGDTIWLKAYLFEATMLTPSKLSGILYVELANDSGMVAQRSMLRISSGLGSAMLPLIEKEIPAGSYTIRAYTNLMRNFGENAAFSKSIYVSSKSENSFVIDTRSVLTSGGKDTVRVLATFSRLDRSKVGIKPFQVRVTDGKRIYLRDEVNSTAEGKMDLNFALPAGADPGKITLLVKDLTKGEIKNEISIPLSLSRIEHTDLQFMPEGGHLVSGLPVKLAFKSVGESGEGVDISGEILNSSNQKITDFKTSFKGMGTVEFLPLSGETYKARITGAEKVWTLPEVKPSGSSIRVLNEAGRDSMDVVITFSSDLIINSPYYLLGQYGNVAGFAALVKGNSRIRIAKKLFPTGIVRFALLNSEKKPLNERVIFVDHADHLRLGFKEDTGSHTTRDSISLDLEVLDKDNKPVRGSFSLSVTDDSQVRPSDSLSSNIYNSILLSADLKGKIEDPGYYLRSGFSAAKDLDNLLLTQGWVGHNWNEAFTNKAPIYEAEPEFMVKGRVLNVFNKALVGTKVNLITTRPLLVLETDTDSLGNFAFNGFPPIDTAVFRLQANNKKGKSFNVGIEMKEFVPPVFSTEKFSIVPWYVNSDTSLLNQARTKVKEERAELSLPAGVKMLQEVTVTAKKIIPGSKNLNGPGNSDFVLDENDLKKLGKKNLLQLLEEQVPKFFVKAFFPPDPPTRFFTINGFKLKIVIDGMFLDFLYHPIACADGKCPDDYMNFQKQYLEYYTAEDIVGFEIMHKGRFGNQYAGTFPDEDKQPETSTYTAKLRSGPPPPPDQSWLEVTTRSGKGPYMRAVPGTYLYRAIPFAADKQFYRPKYLAKNVVSLPDVRSTIHWEPHLVTGKDGRAKVSFYSADQKGTYTINVQGTDMNGHVGYTSKKIAIK